MNFTFYATPFKDAPATPSGFSLALRAKTHSKAAYIRLLITLAAQNEHFGKPLEAGKHFLLVELSREPKARFYMKLTVLEDPREDALMLQPSTRGAVCALSDVWLPGPFVDSVPAAKMPVTSTDRANNALILELPKWAILPPMKAGEGQSLMGD
tara:strand:- start:15470 stop:15931 length:462 start_codon:yes stop_codon:yes gene_type:complete